MGAILDALAARHLARLTTLIETLLTDSTQDATNVIDVLLDAYIDFFRREPGMRALWLSDELPARLRKADRESEHILVASICRLLARAPNGGRVTESEVQVSLHLSDSPVELAFRLDPRGDESTLATLRHLVHELFKYYESRRG